MCLVPQINSHLYNVRWAYLLFRSCSSPEIETWLTVNCAQDWIRITATFWDEFHSHYWRAADWNFILIKARYLKCEMNVLIDWNLDIRLLKYFDGTSIFIESIELHLFFYVLFLQWKMSDHDLIRCTFLIPENVDISSKLCLSSFITHSKLNREPVKSYSNATM